MKTMRLVGLVLVVTTCMGVHPSKAEAATAWWSYPRSVDGLRLGIQAVHCGGWGFSVGHILLS
jgi:hypothetical protein